jgi:hypothetical protein
VQFFLRERALEGECSGSVLPEHSPSERNSRVGSRGGGGGGALPRSLGLDLPESETLVFTKYQKTRSQSATRKPEAPVQKSADQVWRGKSWIF